MRILITGICGFVGSSMAESLLERPPDFSIAGIDNLMRPGSEGNRLRLRKLGIAVIHADLRAASDFEALPAADWVIDAAANPSVLAGVQGGFTSRQLFEHNVAALVNVLEYCKVHKAGLLLLSTSRVYSIPALISLPLKDCRNSFQLDGAAALPRGVTARGSGPDFSNDPPISLYGSTKLASETLALEWGAAFDFPMWIDRCGALAGAQMAGSHRAGPRIYTAGGGQENSMSLAQLTAWCDARFGPHRPPPDDRERPYDIARLAMDSTFAERDFCWRIETNLETILDEIAAHAQEHPPWLETSGL